MAKSNSEFKSIQKKLVAAVAMVLVASIMVVSSSYAWFTLSTAPEVKGIQTSVGSNGNLEMALIDSSLAAIETGTGGSMNFPQANYTWGNLVNLEDPSYNLEGISLMPARLNMTPVADGYKLGDAYLQAPAYGVDGRISTFSNVPYSGTYDAGKGYFIANQTTGFTPKFGVRAVGTTSGLSPEKMVLLEAISLMNSTKDSVTRKASASLSQDAIDLANIMMRGMLADNASTVTITAAEFGQVKDAVKNLRSIVTELKAAMDQVVIAVGASQKITVTNAGINYNNGTDITATGTKDGSDASVDWTDGDLPAIKSALLESWNVLFNGADSPDAKLTSAEGLITGAGTAETYPYTTVEDIMKCILDTDDMKVRGNAGEGKENVSVPITMEKKEDLIAIAFNSLTAGEPVNVDITGGIYAGIHDFVGHYYGTAKLAVDLTGTKFESELPAGMTKINVNAAMNVEGDPSIETTYYLPWFSNKLTGLDVVGDSAGSDEIRITDAYGYAIDLGFRTNAVGSNLMLQTSAASRVDGNLADGVQGGGSYMKFKLAGGANGDENYSVSQMTGLMDAIRVILVDFSTGEVYGVAKLDVTNAAVTNETEDAETVTYVTAYLNLYNFTFNDGKLTIGDMIQADAEGRTAITALQQNIALGISALVYLDGDYVENSDVAIRGDSAVGTLNLQFSSSADLEPMKYTFSDDQTPATPTTTPAAPTTTPAGEP